MIHHKKKNKQKQQKYIDIFLFELKQKQIK